MIDIRSPHDVIRDLPDLLVGRCITMDGYGEYLLGKMVVQTGWMPSAPGFVYHRWELQTEDGECITSGKWEPSLMAICEDAKKFLADPTKILVNW